MSGAPTLLLCVGATKAGTSWLYRHLAAHPDCHLRGVKELHYFDTIENGTFRRQIRLLREYARRLPANGTRAADARAWMRVLKREVEDVPAYLGYLTQGAGSRRLVADITPAYALLPVARLRAMATMTPDVRFLYILRDPLSRLWSHVRMLAVRAAAQAAEVPAQARAIMARLLAGDEPGVAARGDYIAVVGRLAQAAAAERVSVVVQDDLMTPGGIARLWSFLGIGAGPVDLARRVHQGVPLPMDPDQEAAARAWLAPQYAFVQARFGRLPQGWQAAGSGEAA